MPQAKLISAKEVANGIKITFLTEENKTVTGIYNRENLNLNDLQRLIGSKIAYSESKNNFHITKAWEGEKPVYCDDKSHGFDR